MKKKTVFICGGSSGIGKAVLQKYLSEGYFVFSTSRRKPDIKSKYLTHLNSNFYDNKSILHVCEEVIKLSNGRLDAVVNCVGDIITENTIVDFEFKKVYDTFQINFFSSFYLSKLLFKIIAKNKGCFLFLSSVGKDRVYPMISDYCSAKAALSTFVKSLANELAPYKGRAVAISPAVVRTPLFEKSKYSIEEASSWHKLSRIGEPSELSELIFFLTSEQASWITGIDYIIDGGMLL